MSLFFIGLAKANKQPDFYTRTLSSGWKMQPADKLIGIDERQVSENSFDAQKWYDAVVPGTVMGALASNKVIEDPTFGINIQKVDTIQFKFNHPWWYRTTFNLSASDFGKKVSLRFNGTCYRANLWVNGQKVIGNELFAGTYRMFMFNINSYIKKGENTVALKLSRFANGEYSLGFCDWNPLPTDRSMGIFREIFLEINDGIKIVSPFVYSKVDTASKSAADLYIQAEIVNSTDRPIDGIVRVDYEVGLVAKTVTIKAHDTLSVRFNPDEYSQLSVKNVELWWPNGMGKAKRYKLKQNLLLSKHILLSLTID